MQVRFKVCCCAGANFQVCLSVYVCKFAFVRVQWPRCSKQLPTYSLPSDANNTTSAPFPPTPNPSGYSYYQRQGPDGNILPLPRRGASQSLPHLPISRAASPEPASREQGKQQVREAPVPKEYLRDGRGGILRVKP